MILLETQYQQKAGNQQTAEWEFIAKSWNGLSLNNAQMDDVR